MIRLFLILSFGFIFLFASSVDKKIKTTNTKLNTFSKSYSNINKKMANNAKAILLQKSKIFKQQKYLKKLKLELSKKESSYKSNSLELKEMKKTQDGLKVNQDKTELELSSVIAQSISLTVVLEAEYSADIDSMIEFEVLQVMLKDSKDKAKKLSNIFHKNSKDIDVLNKKTTSLEAEISKIDKKRKKLIVTQKSNKKALKKLKLAKALYKKELKKLLKKQDTLKKTLAKLNIIKIDKIKKAKEEEARRVAFRTKKSVTSEKLPRVKKHGSSYQAIKTKKYRGRKTIAPLDSYTITKKYGTYTDPIYGIKIFNESISLKPKKANAKVKTVFNGKVIYADKTAVLDNIVIVEHKNGLHTIYANLSKISPNIRKGKKIKKGYTIGRVSEELIFEVTQKSYHINPIRLF
ncbi:MAG: M23 family metallopeptidase, partial [Campylobacterota bacterium]|nr:M23 family metallopeptidase [Campylobacterota bacterium]